LHSRNSVSSLTPREAPGPSRAAIARLFPTFPVAFAKIRDTYRYSNNDKLREMSAVKRRYRQTARAASAEGLRRKIVLAFHDLLLARWIDEITLDEVAASASTTRQSVIRLFGGKEGLIEAVIELLKAQAAPRILLPLSVSRQAALEALVEHYETVGDMIYRLLAQEERHPALRPQLDFGRRAHRAWIAERFAPALASLDAGARERQITRLVVATDLYAWKLLRRDFGHSPDEVVDLIAGMVNAIVKGGKT
jgi:AcrR family transcriptional regulator